jgi:hypothetical protein
MVPYQSTSKNWTELCKEGVQHMLISRTPHARFWSDLGESGSRLRRNIRSCVLLSMMPGVYVSCSAAESDATFFYWSVDYCTVLKRVMKNDE